MRLRLHRIVCLRIDDVMRLISIVLFTVVTAFSHANSSGVVAPQESAPLIDGTVSNGEYGLSLQYDNIAVHLTIVADILYVGVDARTSGWVAVGFGSPLMDGAHILFGFVKRNGEVFFAEQIGHEHRHDDVSETLVITHAVTEQDGVTTLEASLPAAFVRGSVNDRGTFPMIFAYSRRDSVRTVHRFYKSIELNFR